jgi:hypothetical protein
MDLMVDRSENVKRSSNHHRAANNTPRRAADADKQRIELLIERLPRPVRSTVRFLKQPSGRHFRISAGVFLTFGGLLGFLPIVGFWMLPIGLALLADDVQLLRSYRTRILDWIERRNLDWRHARVDRLRQRDCASP